LRFDREHIDLREERLPQAGAAQRGGVVRVKILQWTLRKRAQSTAFFAVVVMTFALVGGCHAPTVERPLTASLPADPLEAQMEFWHGLETRPLTCNDEAFHGLLLFMDGKDDAGSYWNRVATLKGRKLLPANFDRPGIEAVHRGTVAVILVQVLKVRGGWALTLFGPTPRYATRELMFQGVFPLSAPDQTFSGAEFVGIIGKAEDYQRGENGGGSGMEAVVGR
jgi:hypothetical protein